MYSEPILWFVQDNHSRSKKTVLRGLHYQVEQPQGKLVRAVAGTIFDVAVDIRPLSSTYGRWVGVELSSENKQQPGRSRKPSYPLAVGGGRSSHSVGAATNIIPAPSSG